MARKGQGSSTAGDVALFVGLGVVMLALAALIGWVLSGDTSGGATEMASATASQRVARMLPTDLKEGIAAVLAVGFAGFGLFCFFTAGKTIVDAMGAGRAGRRKGRSGR